MNNVKNEQNCKTINERELIKDMYIVHNYFGPKN